MRLHLSTLCQALILLCVSSVPTAAAADLSGTVKDATGGAVANARILVLTAQRAVVATATSDQDGKFTVRNLADADYLVIAQHPPFAERQTAVKVSGASPVSIDVVLDIVTTSENVSVTATPGYLTDLSKASQPVNVIRQEEVTIRAMTVVAQAVEGEVGLALQRTSPGMAGIFVRGLTGNKVNVFVDGVRYSNGAQRGGVNTFLDLIDPSVLDGIEVLRGTSSAQYGSDALGGSIQFLTHVPALAIGAARRAGGTVTVGGETAHRGGFGAGTFNYAGTRFGLLGTFTGRKTGDYRPGGGNDTHSALTRFFGLPSESFIGERMPETGFHQTAGQVRANWVPTAGHLGRGQLRFIAAGRGQPLGSDPGRRRQSHRRAQRPAARSRLRPSRELACRLVRSGLGHLFVQHATRRAGQSRGTGRSERRDRASTGTHDDQWRADQRISSDLVAPELARRGRRVLRGARLRLVRCESCRLGRA